MASYNLMATVVDELIVKHRKSAIDSESHLAVAVNLFQSNVSGALKMC